MIRHPQAQGSFPGKLQRRAFILGATAISLAGCGGGELVALIPGVGTGGTGIVAGVITGLGSVYVDGVRYDDSQAVLECQPDLLRTQALGPSDLHLGQYVYVHLDALGTPTRVRLESQLVGPAAQIEVERGRLQVGGQAVVLNGDPTSGPVTVLAGLASLDELVAGDALQVYGLLQADPADAGSDFIRASRIERVQREATPARVTGTLRRSGMGWALAGLPLATQSIVDFAARGTLADGAAVTVVVPWPAGAERPASWQALAMQSLGRPRFAADTLRVSGAAQLLPGSRALVQGVVVDLSDPALAALRLAVMNGSYMTVQGQLDAGTGQLAARTVDMLPHGGRGIELRGAVTAVLAPGVFVVRGQRVEARAAQWLADQSALAVGRYVEVAGRIMGSVLLADRVALPASLPEQAVLDVSGTVQSVDSASGTVRLMAAGGQVMTVSFNASSMALPRPGETIRAAGYWRGGMLQVH